MKIILTILLLVLSLPISAEKNCLTEKQVLETLDSGIIDKLIKPRITLEATLENLEFLNVVRSTLDPNNEQQNAMIGLIDLRTNNELSFIVMSIKSGMLHDLLSKKSKRLEVVIETIEESRKEVVTSIDLQPLEDLKSYINITN